MALSCPDVQESVVLLVPAVLSSGSWCRLTPAGPCSTLTGGGEDPYRTSLIVGYDAGIGL